MRSMIAGVVVAGVVGGGRHGVLVMAGGGVVVGEEREWVGETSYLDFLATRHSIDLSEMGRMALNGRARV